MVNNLLKTSLLIGFSAFVTFAGFSQNEKKNNNGYLFNDLIRLDATPVISQDITGTCWSFSTTSFLESELIRMGKADVDLSEMYQVHRIYTEKAINYVRRQGKAQFGEGSLSHDVIRSVAKYGVVPQDVYSGKNYEGEKYMHGEMDAILKAMLDAVVSNPNGKLSSAWQDAYSSVLDTYMGEIPETFEVDGQSYTPNSYAEALGINPDDYVSITSFNHLPIGEFSTLQVPDNWSNEAYLNVTLVEFIKILDYALEEGYTIAWDADVSEKTWKTRDGVAIIPKTSYAEMTKENRQALGKVYMEEAVITQEMRQTAFDNYSTTDDHLMHIIGKARDQHNNSYYIVKNSWGTKAGIEGYQYVSAAYMKMKSIAFLLHKEALPGNIKKML